MSDRQSLPFEEVLRCKICPICTIQYVLHNEGLHIAPVHWVKPSIPILYHLMIRSPNFLTLPFTIIRKLMTPGNSYVSSHTKQSLDWILGRNRWMTIYCKKFQIISVANLYRDVLCSPECTYHGRQQLRGIILTEEVVFRPTQWG